MVDTNPSCRQLMWQLSPMGPNDQVPTPQIANIDPRLQQATPGLAKAMFNKVLSSAGTSPSIMYMLNCLPANGFQNELWGRMVEHTVLLFWMESNANPGAHMAGLIDQMTSRLMVLMAADLAMQNPQLMQNLSPQEAESARRFGPAYQGLVPQLMQLRASSHYSQAKPNNNPIFNGVGGYTAYPAAHAAHAAPTPGWNQPQVGAIGAMTGAGAAPQPVRTANSAAVGDFGPKHGAGSFFQTISAESVKKPVQGGGSILDALGLTKRPQASQVAPVAPQVELGTKAVVIEKDSVKTVTMGGQLAEQLAVEVPWTPTSTQLYKPAVVSYLDKRVLKTTRISGVASSPFYQVFNLDENEMNRADHELSYASLLQKDNLYKDLKPAEVVDSDLRISSESLAAIRLRETPEHTEALSNYAFVRLETSDLYEGISEAVSVARRLSLTQPFVGSTYTMQCGFTLDLIAKVDLTELIENLAKATTILQLVSGLKQALEDAQKTPEEGKEESTEELTHRTETIRAISRIDAFLTRELMKFLKNRMGLGTMSLGSFITDALDVAPHIRQKYGTLYSTAFEQNERTFIMGVLYGFQQETVNSTPEEGQEPIIFGYHNTVCMQSTIAVLTVTKELFGIQIAGNEAQQVMASNLPGLHAYIKELVALSPDSLHYYLVTSDDHVYEVAQSIVGHEIYTISNGPALV